MDGKGLSGWDRKVWDAFPRGDAVDIPHAAGVSGEEGPAPEATVQADVIAALLLRARAPDAGRVPAVRVSGARVTGLLDLSFADVAYAVLLRDCVFDEEPQLNGTITRLVNLSGSRLPGLQLSDAQVNGLLWLEGCRFDGPVRLSGARVAQALSLRGAQLRGDPALLAGGLSVGRNMVCSGMLATGGCMMANCRISGTLFLDGASFSAPGGVALGADGLVAEGGVFCRDRFAAEGEVQLQDARIGRQFTMAGASLRNPGGNALNAERLAVDGALYLDDDFAATGQVMLRAAAIRGALYLGAKLSNPAGVALMANRATIESGIFARRGLVVCGEVSLGGTYVRGSVDLAGARIINPGGTAIDAERIEVTGQLFFGVDFAAEGEIRLVDARLGAGLYFRGSRLSNTAGRTLTGWGLAVGGVVNCSDGFTADGPISLVGARLASELSFNAAIIQADINLRRLHAAVLRADSRTVIKGTVDLRYASIEVIRDDPAGWPRAAKLDGFTYTTLESSLPVAQRLGLLDRDPGGYHPQPFEQLAAVYRGMGNDAAARTVLLAKQRKRRQAIAAPLQAWGLVQDWMVGYGYRPQRAALWLAALLIIGTAAFTIHHPAPLDRAHAPQFVSLLYTLDLLLPIVSFGQKDAFNPLGWQHWLAAALTAAGWILATTIAAGVTRVLSRQ
jgi:hypothetical protein